MTIDPRTACSSSEVLGAFAEGRLGTEERAAVTAHLDTCARCREEVAMLADYVDESAQPARRLPMRWAAAAAGIIVIAAATALWRTAARRETSLVAPLITASAALDHRSIEPRLHGFAWSAYRGAVRASEEDRTPGRLKVLGAAGDVLQHAGNSSDADTAHAAGVASLLIDDPAAAIDRLQKAVEQRPNDAAAWSDLAAAHYELATRLGRASHRAEALAAADRALKIDPRLPEALFNRALVLEQLGMIDEARAAWMRYLEIDSGSPWAVEARRRMSALPTPPPAAKFEKMLDSLEPAELVARFPQQARAYGEAEILGRWGETSDDALLSKARAIGAALQERSGETLLADAVRSIDEADAAGRARIAAAHRAYRSGRIALSKADTVTARASLLRAASLFGNDPAALNARHFAAVAEYEAGHAGVAERELQALANDLPERDRALRAQTEWQLGIIDGSEGRWASALKQYTQARTTFAELGETSNAAFVDALLGEAAILLGRRDEAWSGWSRALDALERYGLYDRLRVTLALISRTESMTGHNAAAASILDLELARATGDARLRADALFRRAIVCARMHDAAGAKRAVEDGAPAANRIADAAARQEALANLHLASGIAYGDDPSRALTMLDGAVAHFRARRPLLLPVALRERARVLRAVGRDDDAVVDLRAAVDAIEQQRGEVEWRDVRAAAIDGVEGIYLSLAELLLAHGRDEEAFTVVDRAAAHGFYGAAATRSEVTVAALQRSLGNDAVIEYLTLPRELVIFAVTARTFAVRRVAVDDLPRRVAQLNEAIRNRGDVQGASLYPTLIAPADDLLAGRGTITLIPDATLEPVPFSALFDAHTGRWLIESHAICRAPAALAQERGADVPVRTERTRRPLPTERARIVVIEPPAPDLRSAADEARAIAARYRDAEVIEKDDPAAVLAAIGNADVIHYAGHTSSSGETGLALGKTVLHASDIARLHLRAAPLVVLAGCRTMRGAAHGDDVTTSLARAFLLAGAHAVIGTSWDLDDRSSAGFFERMHAANAATGDAVAALREAQRAALTQSASPPAEWAAAEIVVRSAFTEKGRS